MIPEFKPFPKIEQVGKLFMVITQKIHGTNAQITIYEDSGTLKAVAGSRTRWLTPDDDNFGFAKYVAENEVDIIEKLGVGTHFGEWAGPGINIGEGLKEKTFILFNFHEFPPERPLPKQMATIPLLYKGKLDFSKIEETMADLKTNGSKLVSGYMKPEGIVITLNGTRFKKVFQEEETAWSRSEKPKIDLNNLPDVTHLLQPIRLEKLLSRDESYTRNYPESLPTICKDYIADLESEGQLADNKVIKKALGKAVFKFVKEIAEKT